MRLWSIHPQYLDTAGLVALWREGLLAQAVLGGRTRGYTRHPQLVRFREQSDPLAAIASYLHAVADEADGRGYSFDRGRLLNGPDAFSIRVSEGQLRFEWEHLRAKLRARSPEKYREAARVGDPLPHPAFVVVPGSVAEWEKGERARR